MFISVIVPVFNEKEIIKENLRAVKKYLSANFNKYEIIVVDDGSTDDTLWEMAEENIIIISLGKNKGKGEAVRQGMEYARGDYAFFIDGDLPYPLSFIEKSLPFFKENHIVAGRRVGEYPTHRKIASRLYNKLANMLLGVDVTDLQCGIKGFRKDAYKHLFADLKTKGFAFDTEVLYKAKTKGYKIAQLPVLLNHRKQSRVKLTSAFKILRDLIKIYEG